jgi:hypothetical protein
MAALHWKAELLHRDGQRLLPSKLPIEVLIHVARSMAMYKDGALDRFEMEGVWEFLRFWVNKLLDAQHESRGCVLAEGPNDLLESLVDELDLWIRLELVSRLIGYPIYSLTITELFQHQFAAANYSTGKKKQTKR